MQVECWTLSFLMYLVSVSEYPLVTHENVIWSTIVSELLNQLTI